MPNTHIKTVGFMAFTFLALAACSEGRLDTPKEAPTVDKEAPAPQWSDDPQDELARYNGYLSQAGFMSPEQLGAEKEVQVCDVLAQQGSFTFDSGNNRTCVWQQSEPGWVIESVGVQVLENKNDRGSYTYSVIAADGQFHMDTKEIGNKWNAAIDLAGKAGDVSVEKKLEIGFQHHMERVLNLSSDKNSVYVEANANGGLFQSSIIHVVATAKLVKVE